jgi:predicted GNAT family acetyltransferase
LWVTEEKRREGRATAMMAQLLTDNRSAGEGMTVLLSSKTGAHLYPKLGFEQIGTLLLYQPPR